MEYGNYTSHIQIGYSDDAITILDQLLTEKELDQDVVLVLTAIKDAIKRGIV